MRNRAQSIVANPVLVGAVTMLVIVVAVFLAYNANKGLPFVPTYEIKVESQSASRLVAGNEVRQGGYRIGQVKEMKAIPLGAGKLGAELTLSLDKTAGPIPKDTEMMIRPKGSLGQKYIDVIPGKSKQTVPEGGTIPATQTRTPPEFDDFFEAFTVKTRQDIKANLGTFGTALAGRGTDLNRTFAALPSLLRDVQPVMRTLSDPDTQLSRFFNELQDTAAITVPVADELAHGFTAGADVFEALSQDPRALDQFIARSPDTLREGTVALRGTRPFLRRFANLSDEISGTAHEVRRSAGPVAEALRAGRRVLPDTPELSRDLGRTFDALRDLSTSPTTNLVLQGLTSTATTLNHTLRWVGPHVTVCNYWNYWWTFLSDHISEEVDTGTVQRVQVKFANPLQANSPASFGATEPVDDRTEPPSPSTIGLPTSGFGDPVALHAQPYGRAVDENGNADCETGQRGYPKRLTRVPGRNIVTDPRTPGDQGPTYTGKQRVPDGQTFSAEPEGLAPQVAGK